MRMLALSLIAAVAFTAQAEDKKADDKKAPAKPTGTWVREVDGFNLRMAFGDDLKVTAKTGDNVLNVTFKYEIDKEGVITATVKDVTVKGEFPAKPEAGQTMSFTFKVDGKKAKLNDFKSKDLEHAKDVMEGEYATKTD